MKCLRENVFTWLRASRKAVSTGYIAQVLLALANEAWQRHREMPDLMRRRRAAIWAEVSPGVKMTSNGGRKRRDSVDVMRLANRLFELTLVNACRLEQQMMLQATARQILGDSAFFGVRNFKGADGAAVLLALPASPRVRTE